MYHYRVDVYDLAENLVTQFKDPRIRVEEVLNGVGRFALSVWGGDERVSKIGDDYRIDLVVRDVERGIAWMTVFNGLARGITETQGKDGGWSVVFMGPSLNELVAKENTLWPSNSPQTNKTGVVSMVMLAYANENIGPGATVAAGRDQDGVVPGLVMGSDPNIGPVWSGSRTRKPLLKVMQELSAYSTLNGDPVDFRVRTGATSGFVFEAGLFGTNYTDVGVDVNTGLNVYGNRPLLFAPELRNVDSFQFSLSRHDAFTTVIALGNGSSDDRTFRIAENGYATLTPLSRRTKTISVQSSDLAVLLNAAEAELQKVAPRPSFRFKPSNTIDRLAFRDYGLGDYVTGGRRGVKYHRRITSFVVDTTSSPSPEMGLSDV